MLKYFYTEMTLQKTLRNECELQGPGFIHNLDTRVVFTPAEPSTGLTFFRSDLSGRPSIHCRPASQEPSGNCTILREDSASVAVVEHFLAACAVLGITNLAVEVSGPEMPILDGSAWAYAEKFLAVGLKTQDAPYRKYILSRPLFLSDGEAALLAVPSETLRFSYLLDYSQRPEIGCDFVSVTPELEDLSESLLPARTFISEQDALTAIQNGSIKSTDESMGLIVRPGIKPELRMPGEFARHKILDLMGDLHVLGKAVHAHYLGIKSGHKLNARLVRELAARFP